MKLRLIFLLVFLINIPFASAQKENQESAKKQVIKIDENKNLQPVKLNPQQFENFKKDKDFDYSRQYNPENWWEAFKDWLRHLWVSFWEKIFGEIQPGSWIVSFMQIMKYVLIAVVLGFIAWLFIRLNPGKSMVKPSRLPEVLLSEEEKVMNSQNISKLIEQAQTEQNYRLAIRYYYLWILKLLRDHNLIDYQYQKTNREYQQEISQSSLASQFGVITRLYDFIWYGDFKLNNRQYESAKKEFEEIQQQLKAFSHV